MKLLIAGSRDFTNQERFLEGLDHLALWKQGVSQVISGGATGADALAKEWALAHAIPYRECRAEWHLHGRAAGPIRNKKMAHLCDCAVLFWDGLSRGTENMLSNLIAARKNVYVVAI